MWLQLVLPIRHREAWRSLRLYHLYQVCHRQPRHRGNSRHRLDLSFLLRQETLASQTFRLHGLLKGHPLRRSSLDPTIAH